MQINFYILPVAFPTVKTRAIVSKKKWWTQSFITRIKPAVVNGDLTVTAFITELTLTSVVIDHIEACSIIITRLRQTLINIDLAVLTWR